MTASPENILLSHGGGGQHTRNLIDKIFLPAFSNPLLENLGDSAILQLGNLRLAFTTDTFVVKPLFFPGGNIGELAVCGTVNDLSVSGARPLYLSAGFVIEEGFPIDTLKKIIDSMAEMAEKAGVLIVTGDTKVVEKGSADGIFINTAGIGIVEETLLPESPIAAGDKIIINGTLGDHGIAVLSAREELPMESEIVSDTAPLNHLIFPVLEKFPGKIRFMRDATRGGFATVLNEICEGKTFGVTVDETIVPVREDVAAICEMLGFDPLYLANEGKAVFIVDGNSADEIVKIMRENPLGKDSAIVGKITGDHPGRVVLKTVIGGGRILDVLIGDQLPRIC